MHVAMLPHSFRLFKAGQHFELAASCVREKDLWLASIGEAVKHVPTWIGEPRPSFLCDRSKFFVESTPPSATASDDAHSEIAEEELASSSGDVGGLPTIFSIPDVTEAGEPRPMHTEPLFASLREHVHGKSGRKKRLSAMSTGSRRHPQPPQSDEETPPSRRSSSSTSVMSIFSPIHMPSLDREKEKDREKETETVLITRCSAPARQAIDFGLQDVISAACASARAEASWRERVDVGPGAVRGSTKAKTSSCVTMGSMRGMAILSKHESVRVPRKRMSVTAEILNRPAPSSSLSKGHSGRKNVKKLSLTSFSFLESTTSLQGESTSTTTSDSSSSQNSSLQAVIENLSTPISATFISVPSDHPSQSKSSRSFVQNVKDIFHFRPVVTSPVSVIVSHPTQSFLHSATYMDTLQQGNKVATNINSAVYTSGHALLKRFSKDSGRLHGKDDREFVTITSIHEVDEDVAKETFSVAMPVIAAAPVMII